MAKKKPVMATIGEYHTYVSWTYTPKPKTKEERLVNLNLLALFGKVGAMAVRSLRKKNANS
jgi:hypothetical protein